MAGIRKKFSFQLLYALSQAVFPLITYPYITRTIGAAGLGIIGYVDYVSGFVITLAAFGIPFYGVREAARRQQQTTQRQLLFRQLFTVHLFTSFVGSLVFVVIIKANQNQYVPTSLLLLGCTNILLPPFIAEWYMHGMEAFQFTTIRSIVLRSLGLVAMLLLISSSQDYVFYFLIVVAVQAAVALTNSAKIGIRNITLQLNGLKEHLRPLWHFFLTASVISIYVFFDVIILSWFADEKEVGFYTLAIRLVKLSLLIVLSLNVILFPRISQLFAADDHGAIRLLLQKALQFIILITLPLAAGFYFLAPQIVQLLAGEGFLRSVILVQTLSLLPFVVGLSNLFVYQVLVPFGREKKLLAAVCCTCAASLLLHISLVQFYQAGGTAVATLLTEICMTLLAASFAYRTFRFTFPVKTVWHSVLAALPLIFLILLLQKWFTNPALILLCSAVPGLLLYGIMQLYLFRNSFLRETAKSLSLRKKLTVSNG